MPGMGSVTPDESQFPANLGLAHAAVLNGVPPTNFANYTSEMWAITPKDMNVADAMLDASSMGGGSPFAMVEAYDPDEDIASVQSEYDKFSTLVDALNPATDLEAAIDAAVTWYDTNIEDSGDEIADLVAATEAASRPEHLRAKTRVSAGFQDIRAVMTTQFGMAMASMEHERAMRLLDMEKNLTLFGRRERTQTVLNLANAYLGQSQRQIAQVQTATSMLNDLMRVKVATKQDQIEADLMYEEKDALWDLELFNYHSNVLASIQGAGTMPRSQTQRERVAAALTTSISQAAQVGVATRSEEWGVATGLLAFAGQMWGMG